MDIFSAYEMDGNAVNKGIWADLMLMGNKIGAVRVRPSDPDLNVEYRKALADTGVLFSKLRADKGEVSDDDQTDRMIDVMVETILTDWELFEEKDGKDVPIKFTKKKAAELLRKLPKLRKAVEQAARGWTNYRKSAAKEAVKA